ncbi:ABC transporter permease [Deinococcus cellulosilyticus]|uniref:ABC transporter n=1 Tax=Deinococcus cellulosilyticus (strain DSM 18568 / NBRC 106333 / KACC 11606 / 5516J-15) TaxID=1223518 RepID=A0A511MWZ6_DEIC1|nr:ABC transporter permease [Deinococcus cellulosilyticus]GEM45090.1 ABC transporter [Deinococcus cellulosilyticus NBRC 106333 = KACC 11606]
MRTDFILHVLGKEILSTWRDRRTLMSTILLPLIMIPIFTLGFPLLIGKAFQGEEQARQKVGVVGLERMPAELRTFLEEDKKVNGKVVSAGVELIATSKPVEDVQAGTLDAALSIPENLPTDAGGTAATIQIYVKQNSLKSVGVMSKLEGAVNAYKDILVEKKLTASGLSKEVLTPIQTETVDASTTAEKRSGQLAFIIPMFILQFILAGAQPTAIDSTAGEKERGTFEVLLVSPIRRLEVVLGKLGAVTVFSLVSSIFSVIGLVLAGLAAKFLLPRLLDEQAGQESISSTFGGSLSLDSTSLLLLLGVALTVALLVSVIVLTISVYARNFKEAQTYLVPFSLVVVIPAVALQFSDFLKASSALYATPLIGSMLSIMDIVKGAVKPDMMAVTCVSNLVFTGLLLLLALRSFSREEVIFRN